MPVGYTAKHPVHYKNTERKSIRRSYTFSIEINTQLWNKRQNKKRLWGRIERFRYIFQSGRV